MGSFHGSGVGAPTPGATGNSNPMSICKGAKEQARPGPLEQVASGGSEATPEGRHHQARKGPAGRV